MPSFRTATVTEILDTRDGVQKLALRMPDGSTARGYALTQLVGDAAAGDEVVCNTTAVELALGTGGWHFVHWNLSRRELAQPGPEHIMKLRYTSLQADVGTDELAHPEVDVDLSGQPVVVCSVHSQVAVVAATLHALVPDARLVYVMTDGASLPIAMSDLVASMLERGVLDSTVTCGHAFGGSLEAVNVASGISLAVNVGGADVVIVGMGPGVVGTGTALGTTALEVAPALDAAATLGGEPVLCVRASDGDPRPRHQGVSHHMETVCRFSAARPWVAAVPAEAAQLPGVRVAPTPPVDVAAALDAVGLHVTTMGRDIGADPLFFAAAGAAGALVASMLERGTPHPSSGPTRSS